MAKYLDTSTFNTITKFYKTTFTYDTIFTKDDASTSDEQVGNFTREFNIHYRSCIESFIYLLPARAHFSFAVHKLERFSSNTSKVYFEGLVNFLRYNRENKTLGLKYYADMKYAPSSYLLRQSNINTENQLMELSDSSWEYFPVTGISTGVYMISYQDGPINHGTHVPGPVAQPCSESEYNA